MLLTFLFLPSNYFHVLQLFSSKKEANYILYADSENCLESMSPVDFLIHSPSAGCILHPLSWTLFQVPHSLPLLGLPCRALLSFIAHVKPSSSRNDVEVITFINAGIRKPFAVLRRKEGEEEEWGAGTEGEAVWALLRNSGYNGREGRP